ncbi:hypothetical protein GLU60_02730 [Nanohaloarchaea archaeon H01]|nr:hypothetical protein [Nanohaloarchaea archaeon H01]
MSGSHPSKIELEDAKVYVHKKDESSGSQNIHIDVEHEELNEIVEPGENSFVGGKQGGVFIGLKDKMIERAENWVKENE